MHPSNKLSNIRRRVNRARKYPDNTCPASRHLHIIAETLARGEKYPMLDDELEHCASTMLSVLESLWKARTKLAKLKNSRLERRDSQARLKRWIMHDNHTFTKLPADNEAAYKLALECFDRDGGWVTLCGTWSDEHKNPSRRRPELLSGRAKETRPAFAEAALLWLQKNS